VSKKKSKSKKELSKETLRAIQQVVGTKVTCAGCGRKVTLTEEGTCPICGRAFLEEG